MHNESNMNCVFILDDNLKLAKQHIYVCNKL
jgi:hypothetical protein